MKIARLLVALVFALATSALAHAATILVNSAADPAGFNAGITIPSLGSTVTLRDAVNAIRNSGGTHTITFSPDLAGQTILLAHATDGGTSALITGDGLATQMTIQGLTGPQGITIAISPEADQMRIFFCQGGQSSQLTLNDLTLTGGRAPGLHPGGAIFNSGTRITLNRCTITGNSADLGGGLYMGGIVGQLTLNNCTVHGNSAANQGGGIYLYQGQLTLNHVTLTGNSAVQGGGLTVSSSGFYPTVTNTIIAGNSASLNTPEIFGGIYQATSHHNLCSDTGTTPGLFNGAGGMVNGVNGNILGADPLLGPLASNGGPTQSRALLNQSRAINAAAAVGAPATDQRGIARPQGSVPDIGAYEARIPVEVSVSTASLVVLKSDPAIDLASASGASPAGGVFSGTGVSGGQFLPATVAPGTYVISYTVTAAASADGITAVSATITITVNQAPAITSASSASFPVGSANFFVITRTGVPTPGLSMTGALPSGINFNLGGNGSYFLSGTVAAGTGGSYPLVFTASNGFGTPAVQNFTLTVTQPPAITSANQATFTVGTAAGFTATATGYPTPTFTKSGALPSGITLSSSGALSGTPAAGSAGTYVITLTAGNSVGSSPQTFTLTVLEAPSLVVTTGSDVVSTMDNKTSLREAVLFAENNPGADTITFAPALQGQTVTLVDGWSGSGDDTALRNYTELTIDGGAGVTIHLTSPTPRRLFLNGGALTLHNLTLSGGDIRGGNDGGALWNNGTVTIAHVRFTQNQANHGGAIFNVGTMSISGSTFDQNSTAANGGGGAIWSSHTLGISGSTFYQNTAAVLGGAILSSDGLTVSDSNFSTNHSDFNGGALRLAGSALITGCTMSNNTAANGGGALISHGQTTLTNTTIAHNTALDGGGAQFFEGTASLRHVTIAHNSASRSGGGLAVNSADVTLTNTIVAGNVAPDQNNLWGTPLNAASSHNLTDTPLAQLYLGSLAANGGPTLTLALLPGSPAINAGATITGVTTDQRGLARSTGTAPDIGAVEDATGNDDPDGDTLTNRQELALHTDPLAIDSDDDGFNEATEMLAGTNPSSAASMPPPTHLERVLGFGPARGLDLSGNFRYAFNVGTPGAAGQAGDAIFTADSAPGITVSAAHEISDWTVRDFGPGAAEEALATVFRSIRWGHPLTVSLADLVAGRRYKLQLLFAESSDYHRLFDVLVDGVLIADDFSVAGAQGTPVRPGAAAAIVYEFTATDPVLGITLTGADVADLTADRNATLSGVTLEEIPTPAAAPLITPPSGTFAGGLSVTLSTPAAGAVIRYTTDGSTPSATHGVLYSGPFDLVSSATVRAIASGGGWLDSTISSASYVVLAPLQDWRALHSLAADGSEDLGNPSGDGTANLLKYAFNLAPHAGDLAVSNSSVLPEQGTAGLPRFSRNAQDRLVITFVRRKASTYPAITYTVETGAEVGNLSPLDLSAAAVASIDADWERVTVTDPATTLHRFGRVRVTPLGD